MPGTSRRPLDLPRPGQGGWPGLWSPPRSVVRARIAESLFRRAVRALPVRVVLPGGHVLGAGGPGAPDMRVHRPEAFFRRLGVDVKIGFGEAYVVGDWTSTALADLLTAFAAKPTTLVPPVLQPLRRWVERRHPASDGNDVVNATTRPGGCGSSTWPTPKRASGWATRVSASSPR